MANLQRIICDRSTSADIFEDFDNTKDKNGRLRYSRLFLRPLGLIARSSPDLYELRFIIMRASGTIDGGYSFTDFKKEVVNSNFAFGKIGFMKEISEFINCYDREVIENNLDKPVIYYFSKSYTFGVRRKKEQRYTEFGTMKMYLLCGVELRKHKRF